MNIFSLYTYKLVLNDLLLNFQLSWWLYVLCLYRCFKRLGEASLRIITQTPQECGHFFDSPLPYSECMWLQKHSSTYKKEKYYRI